MYIYVVRRSFVITFYTNIYQYKVKSIKIDEWDNIDN